MKKITKFFFLIVAIAAWGNFANAQTSAYCSTPSGHFNDPNFAAAASHILLTITNIDANNIRVKVEPNTDGAPIDFLQVNASGATPVIVGTDEGALLPEYVATIYYATPPTDVTLTIFWSNPGWAGRWMIQDLVVPFNATCSSTPPPPTGQKTIDFETVGHNFSWTVFANGDGGTDNPANLTSPFANPNKTGINTSTNCLKFIESATAQPWGGLWTASVGEVTITNESKIFKVMVQKDKISPFGVKLEGLDFGGGVEILVSNTLINQWEELTFDFTAHVGKKFNKLVFLPDFAIPRASGGTIYIDNVVLPTFTPVIAPAPTAPSVAAPTPTVASNKVISLFSGAYSNVPVDTWRTGWSSANFEQVNVDGNPTLKYTSLVFVGAETTGANLINATGMTHFHLDYWTPDMTTFKVKLVDFGANGVWNGGGDDVEHEITINPVSLSQWNSFDRPLSDFTNLTTRAHMAQYIFSGSPTGTVYIDNVYFYNGTTSGINNTENGNDISLYPNPVKDRLNVTAKTDISEVIVRNLVGQNVKSFAVNGLEKSIDLSDVSSGNYLVTVKLANGQLSTQKFVKL